MLNQESFELPQIKILFLSHFERPNHTELLKVFRVPYICNTDCTFVAIPYLTIVENDPNEIPSIRGVCDRSSRNRLRPPVYIVKSRWFARIARVAAESSMRRGTAADVNEPIERTQTMPPLGCAPSCAVACIRRAARRSPCLVSSTTFFLPDETSVPVFLFLSSAGEIY